MLRPRAIASSRAQPLGQQAREGQRQFREFTPFAVNARQQVLQALASRRALDGTDPERRLLLKPNNELG